MSLQRYRKDKRIQNKSMVFYKKNTDTKYLSPLEFSKPNKLYK